MPRRMLLPLLIGLWIVLPLPRAHASPDDQCFPVETGIVDCLQGRFAQYWQANGALPIFGFPITPVFDVAAPPGTVIAQIVERNRLEYHPENQPPYDMLLGRLGVDALQARGRDWQSEPRGEPIEGCWFAAETQHTVCDQGYGEGFLSFYYQNGLDLGDPGVSEREALAQWGLPLTEPDWETTPSGHPVLIQWFERARFEYHPDNPAGSRVLLGLLGRELWGNQPRPPATTQPLPTAVVTAPPAPPAPPASENAGPRQQMFNLVNDLHQRAGCAPYRSDALLETAAQGHADDIAAHRRIDHTGTDGATLRTRLDRVGYPYARASESIAIYPTPEQAVYFWMDEPPDGPHRVNITSCAYTEIGVALAYDRNGRAWWVIDFASRSGG